MPRMPSMERLACYPTGRGAATKRPPGLARAFRLTPAQSKVMCKVVGETEQEKQEKQEKRKQAVMKALFYNTLQAVIQHVMILQSEQHLFIKSCGGDITKATKVLSITTALVGALGLQFNQIGGRLSDAYGRRTMFMMGPLVNFVAGLCVFKMPGNTLVLAAARVLKLMATTFSGTVMGGAAAGDVLNGTELAVAGSKVGSIVGVAVVVAPFLESLLLWLSRGRHRVTYLGLSAMAAVQFATAYCLMPETVTKPAPFDLKKTLQALNPFDSLRVFASKSRMLKRLVVIWMLQMVLEGKNLSDFSQTWMREHLGWSSQRIRNQVALYGAMTTLAGLYCTPYILGKTRVSSFTTIANAGMAIGLLPSLFSTNGIWQFLSMFPQLIGVNGSSASALGPVMKRCADEAGFTQGQYAAYMANLRAIPAVLSPLFIGALHNFVQRKGGHVGVVYPALGFLGAVVPTALLWTTVDRTELDG
uniref:Major facilitator superfamily (MFS) profile domain-containing protein n=1 Tax=Alexandrium catenella TaxID=2925 RepID=A0A7S1WIW4_ALECA